MFVEKRRGDFNVFPGFLNPSLSRSLSFPQNKQVCRLGTDRFIRSWCKLAGGIQGCNLKDSSQF